MKEKVLHASYISAFCMEMHLVMKAGIPLSEGIAIFSEDETNPAVKKILDTIHLQMELGEPVAVAMRAAGGFPEYVVNMLQIGQMTGHLENVFKALSVYYHRQDQMRKSIRNAVVYPVVLLVMMLFVILVLITKVLPIFQSVFQQLGTEMSPIALSIMGAGQWLGSYGLVIVAILAAAALALVVLSKFPEPWHRLMAWLNKMTANWKLQREISSSRLANALVMALSSGMNINESLDMAEHLLASPEMLRRVNQCKGLMTEGIPFAEASNRAGLFSSLYCRMIAVGFKTGNIDSVMEEIAQRSADAVDDSIEGLIGKIEPSLVMIMSVIIGLILLSVMLPLMGIMSAIG